jgi:ABC-2 type transport system permease protein
VTPGAFFRLMAQINAQMVRRRILSVRQQSRLMVTVIALFVLSYWVVGYGLFEWGFKYLTTVPGLGPVLLDRMLYLFFAFLFVMLVFSNMIIGYSSLFKSQETQWMLTLPVRAVDVFCWKLAETTVLASWAFLFLSAPMMLAYGVVRSVTGWYYVKLALLYVPFVVIPGALGALVILIVNRYLHRQMFKWALFAASALMIAWAVMFLKPMDVASLTETQTISVLNRLLHNSRATLQPLLPSYWVASGMIAWGEGGGWRGTLFFLVLLSNAMMGTLVCVTASGRLFYDGWSRNHSQGALQFGHPLLHREVRLSRRSLAERGLELVPWLVPATRALIVKDARVFWRDTSQWSQFVIFFGLLGLYVLNLRNVSYDYSNEFWANFVSFLNLGASSMTLATLTTRFVFPQFSLEGKRLWIVGMVPGGLKRVLLQKFWLSSACAITITLALNLLSSWMLRLPAWMTVLFAATVVLMSFALCGIATGIGALFPNFGSGSTANRRDDNPAKIVSGFGGTLCFVVSLAYIVIVIGALILPLYAHFTADELGESTVRWGLLGAWLVVSLLSAVACCVPMGLALKRLETFEL